MLEKKKKKEEIKVLPGEEDEISADKTPKVKKTTTDDLQRCPNLPSPRGMDLELAVKHLPRSG